MPSSRFAYFIMVHHLPLQFEWLMRAIYDPDDLFLVHVDLKSRLGIKADRRGVMREVRRICADKPNVRLPPVAVHELGRLVAVEDPARRDPHRAEERFGAGATSST